MPIIRIPKEHWETVWYYLTGTGPISRVSKEPEYFVSKRQVALLKRKKMPFEVIEQVNGSRGKKDG
jgi:hypothetical protein